VRFAQLEMSVYIALGRSNVASRSDTIFQTETVLSSLMTSFKFEPSSQRIKWKNDAIAKPYIQFPDGSTGKEPAMPVRVTVLGESE
jgi:hypothetical protein